MLPKHTAPNIRIDELGRWRNWLLQFFILGKNLGALGEAGAIVTNDLELADKIRVLRDHGQNPEIPSCRGRLELPNGCKFRAHVLQSSLRYLDRGNELRRTHAARYNSVFKEVERNHSSA